MIEVNKTKLLIWILLIVSGTMIYLGTHNNDSSAPTLDRGNSITGQVSSVNSTHILSNKTNEALVEHTPKPAVVKGEKSW